MPERRSWLVFFGTFGRSCRRTSGAGVNYWGGQFEGKIVWLPTLDALRTLQHRSHVLELSQFVCPSEDLCGTERPPSLGAQAGSISNPTNCIRRRSGAEATS